MTQLEPTAGGDALLPVPLQLELGGRLRNIGKPKQWYMAVAEAIKNSMDALEDAYVKFNREGLGRSHFGARKRFGLAWYAGPCATRHNPRQWRRI